MDREKVIKALENCKEGGSCDGCEFDIHSSRCIFLLHADALALLKEQKEQIENLKQTAQSMMEGVCLLKEQEAEISKISNAYLDLVGKASKQPVVVRCKECKWGEPTKNAFGEDRIICGNDDTYIDRYITVPADWFCPDGERKET